MEQQRTSVDSSFTLNRTEIWVLEILPPVQKLWLLCTWKAKSLRSHLTFFFSCLQVVLSLGDHSSEVQVVKHLLHSFSHPFSAPSLSGTLLPSSSQNKLRSVEGQPVGPGGPALLSAPLKFHSHKSHWFLCFSLMFFLERKRRADKR